VRILSFVLTVFGAVTVAHGQAARSPAYLTTGIFIGSIEEGARIFTPARLLPFDHREALRHHFRRFCSCIATSSSREALGRHIVSLALEAQ
jgi:hypothetical protein